MPIDISRRTPFLGIQPCLGMKRVPGNTIPWKSPTVASEGLFQIMHAGTNTRFQIRMSYCHFFYMLLQKVVHVSNSCFYWKYWSTTVQFYCTSPPSVGNKARSNRHKIDSHANKSILRPFLNWIQTQTQTGKSSVFPSVITDINFCVCMLP